MTSPEARTQFGDFLKKGSREPVIIKRQQREIGAFIHIEEYRRLRKLSIRACRDPKDNHFLELAVECRATILVTGDDDLLVLDPLRDTRILALSETILMENP